MHMCMRTAPTKLCFRFAEQSLHVRFYPDVCLNSSSLWQGSGRWHRAHARAHNALSKEERARCPAAFFSP